MAIIMGEKGQEGVPAGGMSGLSSSENDSYGKALKGSGNTDVDPKALYEEMMGRSADPSPTATEPEKQVQATSDDAPEPEEAQDNEDPGSDPEKLRATIARRDERISKLEEKNKKLAEERTKAKDELQTMIGRFDKKREEVEAKDAEIDKLRSELREAKESLDRAEREAKKPVPSNNDKVKDLEDKLDYAYKEAKDLKRTLATAEESLKDEKAAKEAAQKALDEANSEIEDLNARISDLESRPAAEPSKSSGTVRRISATTLESDLFTERRYRMFLSRDGRTITFSADVEGKVACSDHKVMIPRLPSLVPFSGPSEHQAYSNNGATFVINL